MTTSSTIATSTPPRQGQVSSFGYAVLVPERRLPLLSGHLAQLREDATTADLVVTIVHPASTGAAIRNLTAEMTRVRLVESPEPDLRSLSEALVEESRHLTTPYLIAHLLRSPAAPADVLAEATALKSDYSSIGWTPDALNLRDDMLPILTPTEHTPRQVGAAYTEVARQVPGTTGTAWNEYLAHLSLVAARPVLEAADPIPGGMVVRIGLGTRALTGSDPPAWRYRVVARDRNGRLASSEPTGLSERFAKIGPSSWDDLVVQIPLAGLSSGTYQLFLEADGARPTTQPLKPRAGVLLPSRPVAVPAGDGRTLRFQVFPSATAGRSMLRLQARTGAIAHLRWALRMAVDDVLFAFRRGIPAQAKRLRLLRMVTLPFFFWRTIWLVGERSDTAQDNGMHLFRHLRGAGARSGRVVHYVIDDESPQRGAVAGLGTLLPHSSWRHRLYMLHARAVIGAFSLHYLIPRQWDPSVFVEHVAWRTDSLQVFLQHGVHMSPRAVRRGSTGYDVMLTSTPRETEALRVSGYDRQLAETGLPRYDALQPSARTRTILFMTTWRQYLVPRLFGGTDEAQNPFEGSSYQRFMSALVAHPRLDAMLNRYDYRLVMLPHYNMVDFFSTLPLVGDRIQIADQDELPVQQQLIHCDGFITDYSSVHFDVAYLGTPLIYARFDEEEYETLHASPGWFDYDAEGFGPVARTLDETLDALEAMLASDCTQPDEYAARVDAAFPHRDGANCARVTDVIETTLASRHAPLSALPEAGKG
ncbi:CDP-glycerol glycerophosphotransferase family protein [Nocardioides sp. AE5]|uniref:CDP-glycerol glycerophosphotransferase family protein n=1 Tax=Nocardioides sp. AE5 TaxID=2962573 RepID=UPI00288286A7|nr:CDP-glycerol glycerophosphotransferase family protein [Nocardioides sp. AE5]MDT0202070.1 CDP-glycerol glycerophosphotransferase family protein [Nocardioides sp. AE5]